MDASFFSTSNTFLKTIIEKLYTDILFECFAALLVKTGQVDSNQIHVLPKENHKRNFRNDLIPVPKEHIHDDIASPYIEDTDNDILHLYTSRSAILDYLPENIYSIADNSLELVDEHGQKRSPEAIKKYKESVKAQFKSAHSFFNPLEVEYNKVRIHRELQEFHYLENFEPLFVALWENIPVKDEKWARFIQSLHLVPFAIGDKTKTQALIEFVLEQPVELDFSVEASCPISEAEQKTLSGNEQLLGFNTILGQCIYDYLDVATLTINDLSTLDFLDYQKETSTNRQLLHEIIKYYFPLNLDVRLNYSINTQKDPPAKAEEQVFILGYSTVLGEN